jgi:hypothetical protein
VAAIVSSYFVTTRGLGWQTGLTLSQHPRIGRVTHATFYNCSRSAVTPNVLRRRRPDGPHHALRVWVPIEALWVLNFCHEGGLRLASSGGGFFSRSLATNCQLVCRDRRFRGSIVHASA